MVAVKRWQGWRIQEVSLSYSLKYKVYARPGGSRPTRLHSETLTQKKKKKKSFLRLKRTIISLFKIWVYSSTPSSLPKTHIVVVSSDSMFIGSENHSSVVLRSSWCYRSWEGWLSQFAVDLLTKTGPSKTTLGQIQIPFTDRKEMSV